MWADFLCFLSGASSDIILHLPITILKIQKKAVTALLHAITAFSDMVTYAL